MAELSANPEDIREKINAEIEKTKALILDYKELTKPIAPDDAIGRVSRMDAINNKTINEAALRQAEDRLQKLQKVLDKFGKPEFGLCAGCGKPIPVGRILIRPESSRCVNCAR